MAIGHKSLVVKELTSYIFGLLYAKRTQFWVGEDGTLQEDAGRVRKGSGARVMDVLRSLIFDLCSFSGKASLAAANRHGHVPHAEVSGTRVNLNRKMERSCSDLPRA
jgi:hypothetical protein